MGKSPEEEEEGVVDFSHFKFDEPEPQNIPEPPTPSRFSHRFVMFSIILIVLIIIQVAITIMAQPTKPQQKANTNAKTQNTKTTPKK